jgi:hypothetical protein
LYTTLADLFRAICDAIRSIFNSTDSIKHQEIPTQLNSIVEEITAQDELIDEISAILDNKANAYPTITFDESTGILTITEVV